MPDSNKKISNWLIENYLQYVAKLRWPENFRCPACGVTFENPSLMERGLYLCRQCKATGGNNKKDAVNLALTFIVALDSFPVYDSNCIVLPGLSCRRKVEKIILQGKLRFYQN